MLPSNLLLLAAAAFSGLASAAPTETIAYTTSGSCPGTTKLSPKSNANNYAAISISNFYLWTVAAAGRLDPNPKSNLHAACTVTFTIPGKSNKKLVVSSFGGRGSLELDVNTTFTHEATISVNDSSSFFSATVAGPYRSSIVGGGEIPEAKKVYGKCGQTTDVTMVASLGLTPKDSKAVGRFHLLQDYVSSEGSLSVGFKWVSC